MTWEDGASAGTTGSWGAGSGGAAAAWADNTTSHTTLRNTSRFVLLGQSASSVRGGVDFAIHLRSTSADGHGAAFLISSHAPVRLHSSGDSLP